MTARVFGIPFNTLYPLYLAKVTKKGREPAELDAVLSWLTGYEPAALPEMTAPLRDFFAQATLPANVTQISGVVCGVRVETIEDPLMQQIRYMDKVVDELAKGWSLAKIRREG